MSLSLCGLLLEVYGGPQFKSGLLGCLLGHEIKAQSGATKNIVRYLVGNTKTILAQYI